MKLKHANIVNFRSIQNVQVVFDPSCRVLVGINESGKSNLLRALSMIDNEFTPSPEDIREPLPNETSITEAYIRFVLTLDNAEMEGVHSVLKPKVLSKKTETLFTKAGKPITFSDFCLLRNEGIYNVDILKQKKSANYWMLDAGYIVSKHWKKPSKSCPADYNVEVGSTALPLKNYSLVYDEDYPEIPATHLEDIDSNYVNTLVGSEVVKIIPQSLPEVIFWKYEEQHLLPPTINIDAFVASPDSVVPLKNMFMLAGIANIAAELSEARHPQ